MGVTLSTGELSRWPLAGPTGIVITTLYIVLTMKAEAIT